MIGRLEQQSFRAMGTSCMVGATMRPGRTEAETPGRALAAARAEVDACDRALSRFDPRSDLSRLNAAGGDWISVDERLVAAVTAALRGRARRPVASSTRRSCRRSSPQGTTGRSTS